MKANYKEKMQPTEMSLGNLYEINQQLMSNEAEIAEDLLQQKKQELTEWIKEQFSQRYLMLLNNDVHDYTVFNLMSNTLTKDAVSTQAANDIVECMQNRGALLALALQEDGAWELWIRTETQCLVYYLFPYGSAVIEY